MSSVIGNVCPARIQMDFDPWQRPRLIKEPHEPLQNTEPEFTERIIIDGAMFNLYSLKCKHCGSFYFVEKRV